MHAYRAIRSVDYVVIKNHKNMFRIQQNDNTKFIQNFFSSHTMSKMELLYLFQNMNSSKPASLDKQFNLSHKTYTIIKSWI